jgi:riboflavin synthase
MFTGAIKDVGQIVSIPGPGHADLIIRSKRLAGSLDVGDPVAVNGVQLTITRRLRGALTVDPTLDALQHTTLGRLQPGDLVNLEPPVHVIGLLTGHIVHGWPDCATTVRDRRDHPDGPTLTVTIPPHLSRYLVPGGWVSLDGVSLTINGLANGAVTTRPNAALQHTTLGRLQPGTPVNLELDTLVRHVERLLAAARLTDSANPPSPIQPTPAWPR